MYDSLGSIASIADLGTLLLQALQILTACSVRCFAVFLVLPATADSAFQGTIRNGIVLCLGTFIAWGQQFDLVTQLPVATLILLMFKELLLGLLLGYAASVVFWIAEGVGVLIDNQAGFNNVQQTNPLSGEKNTPVSNLLSQLAICGFYMLGGMVVLAGMLFESFKWWPLTSVSPIWPSILEDFIRVYTGRYLESVVKVAAPIILVLILVDIGIGLLSKTAEKLDPNSLAQPIKGTVALAMLAILVIVFFDQVRPALSLQMLAQELSNWSQAIRR
jgi:type III secretion protein T